MERELAFSLFPSFLLNDRTTNLGKNTPSQPRFFFQEVLFFLFSPQQTRGKIITTSFLFLVLAVRREAKEEEKRVLSVNNNGERKRRNGVKTRTSEKLRSAGDGAARFLFI
jgi:hypothetical protein